MPWGFRPTRARENSLSRLLYNTSFPPPQTKQAKGSHAFTDAKRFLRPTVSIIVIVSSSEFHTFLVVFCMCSKSSRSNIVHVCIATIFTLKRSSGEAQGAPGPPSRSEGQRRGTLLEHTFDQQKCHTGSLIHSNLHVSQFNVRVASLRTFSSPNDRPTGDVLPADSGAKKRKAHGPRRCFIIGKNSWLDLIHKWCRKR